MKLKNKLIIFFLSLGISMVKSLQAQNDSLHPTEITNVEFKINDLLTWVNANHPLVRIANSELKIGAAKLLEKKGAFDPTLTVQNNSKDLENTNYYDFSRFAVTGNTRSPIKIETGVDYGFGRNINPEMSTTPNGLGFVGISINLLKGLLIDEKRNDLRKAKIYAQLGRIERNILLQDLAESIWNDYLLWYNAYEKYMAFETGVAISSERQLALREMFAIGGCNGMDTLENYIQLKLFEAQSNEWNANTYKYKMQLSRHLWSKDENQWVELNENVFPSPTGLMQLDSICKNISDNVLNIESIPDIQKLKNEQQLKLFNYQLAKNNLLPKLEIKTQLIQNDIPYNWNSLNSYDGNRRFGFSFRTPLFLRKERGELKQSMFEYFQKNEQVRFKQTERQLKILGLIKQVQISIGVFNTLKEVENGYFELYNLERVKYDNGDGTVFLLNTRENRYLTAKVKTIEQELKMRKYEIDLLRSMGQISQTISIK